METSPLICRANQWTGFFMTGNSVMKDLNTHKENLVMFNHECKKGDLNQKEVKLTICSIFSISVINEFSMFYM